MLKRSTRPWNATIALVLVFALITTLFPSLAMAQTDTEVPAEQTEEIQPSAAADSSLTEQMTVILAIAAPVLDSVPAYTNLPQVHVTGTAALASAMKIYLIDNKNVKTLAGQATADEQGKFAIDVPLSVDGVYKITAIASKEGQMSPESAPVQVTLDRVSPAAPYKSTWLSATHDEITLQWQSAEPFGSLKFHIYREGVEIGTTEELEFRDTGLSEQSLVTYKLVSEDLAGNLSGAITVEAGTPPDRLTLLGTSETGAVGNGYFAIPAISGDGTTAAFISNSTNLIEGTGDSGTYLIYIRDLVQNKLEVIIPEGKLSRGNDNDGIAINENGRFIVFTAITGNYSDIYLKDRQSEGSLTRITTGNGDSYSPSISADGKYIVFASYATNMAEGDTNGNADAFVYDRVTGQITRITPTEEYFTIDQTMVSANGKFMVWTQRVNQDAGAREVVLHDIATGTSVTLHEGASNASISGDGRFVAYGTDLAEVYVYDRNAGESRLVKDGITSAMPQISVDGKWVVIYNGNHLLWFNVTTGESKSVGNPAAAAYRPKLSGNGSKIVYDGDFTAVRNEGGFFKRMVFAVCPVSCSSGTSTDQPIESVAWKAYAMIKNQIKLGGELTIATAGAAGGTSTATVAYRFDPAAGGDSEMRENIVTLTESTVKPGSYIGILPIEEGMAEIVTITGEITDSQGKKTSRAADRLPLKVTGAVQVEVELSPSDADPGVLAGARLIAWSAGKKTGAQTAYVGTGPIVLSLADASDYKLSLVGANGMILAEIPEVSVQNGQYAREKLTVRIPAHIRLNVSVPGGGSGLEGVTLSVIDSEGGLIGSGRTDGSGSVAIDAGFTGETVTLSYDMPSPYAALTDETLHLETMTVIGKEATINYGTVTGTVRDAADKAISGASVTVTRPNSVVTVQVNEDGTFQLSAPEGPSMISVVSGELLQNKLKQPVSVIVKAGEETAVELKVLTVRKQLDVELFTRFIGEDWQQLTINSNTGVVYDLEIREDGGASIYRKSMNSPTAWFESYNGAKLSVCIIDLHDRFATVCEPVTLDGSQTPKVTFRLAERAAVTASLPQGFSSQNISLYELTDEGKRRINGIFRKEGPFRISLPRNSTYVLDIRAVETATGKTVGVTRQFTAADGQVLDLGTLQLQEKGVFQNKPGNTLDVLGTESTEGGVIRLRGTYRYDGSQTPLTEASLLLSIPAGTTLIEQSVMLNGQPAQQVDSTEAALAEVKLPVPLVSGASGTIYYELRTEDGTGEYVQPELGIRFKQEGSQDVKEETIGSISVSMVVVSLVAPKIVTKQTLNVSGRAPAGSTVIIEDGLQAVGQAEATPGGTWSQVITLAETAQGGVHALAISAVRGAEVWHSELSYLTYDPNYPIPTELTLSQPGHYYTADVSNGVSRFPYSLAPNSPIVFGLKFSHPERIERAVLQVAGEEIPLTLNPLTKQFEAVKTSHQEKLGGISVTYDVTQLPYDPGTPTTEDLLKQLPPELRNADIRVTQVEQSAVKALEAGDSRVHAATVEIRMEPDAADKAVLDYYYEPVPGYTPKPLPVGEPKIYDFEYDYDSTTMTGHFSAIVPVEEASAAFERMGVIMPMADAGAFTKVVGVVKGISGIASAALNGFDYSQNMGQLNGMLDQVLGSPCLASYQSQYYGARVESLGKRLMEMIVIRDIMQLSGIALAYSGVGFFGGVAVMALTAGLSYKMGSDWQNDLDELKAEFAADNAECEEDSSDTPDNPDDDDDDTVRYGPYPPLGPKLADPDWVYDPSGYTYEAVESNRLVGVTATLLQQSADGSSWSVWNADRYLQMNPLITDGEGRYAWDVPEGNWQVRYDKAGYVTARSEVLTVLPPHFDVNVGLVSREAPQVNGLLQASGKDALFVKFSKYMLPDTLTADMIKVYLTSGEEETEVPVTVEAVNAEQDPDSRTLATTFKLIPQSPFIAGNTYRIAIDSMVQSYAGVPMLQSFEQNLTISDTLPAVQEAIRDMTIIPGYGALGIRWEETDNAEADHLLLKWKAQSGGAEEQRAVGIGEGIAAITDLSAGSYDIRLVTVSLDGRESAGVTVQGQPLVKTSLPVETTPPSEVSLTSVEAGANTLTVKWTDPEDLDLYFVNVRLKKPDSADFDVPFKVAAGTGSYSFNSLTLSGLYEIKLTAVDIRGNESAGVVVQGTIQDPNPEPDPNAAVIVVIMGQKIYDLFDRALSLNILNGSIPAGTKIDIHRFATAPETLPTFLEQRSPVYTLESGETPGKNVQLMLIYDKDGMEGNDHRKLGIYRYDSANPDKWIYVGGIVNPAKGEIQADISEWGTYAVFYKDL